MSRRHPTPEELEKKKQSRVAASQGGGRHNESLTPSRRSASYLNILDKILIEVNNTKAKVSITDMTAAVAKAILKTECEKDSFLTESEMQLVVESSFCGYLSDYLSLQIEPDEVSKSPPGRKKKLRLCGLLENAAICKLFEKCHNFVEKLKNATYDIISQLVSFFCALADRIKIITKEDIGFGHVTCFYKIIQECFKDKLGKLPCLKSIQNGVRWFWDWSKMFRWKNVKREREKHRLWERLYNIITDNILQLEPALAI